MNVTANGEQPENGSGPLSWIGTALSIVCGLAPDMQCLRVTSCAGRYLYLRKQSGKSCCCL